MVNRVIWVVLDSVGMGELPDAADYNDEGSNTLGNISCKLGGLALPNLESLGLGNIDGMVGYNAVKNPKGAYGRMAEMSCGKDTTVGHWEMCGIYSKYPMPTYPNGFLQEIIDEFIKKTGVKGVLGNCVASGTEIIARLGDEHLRTEYPIVYTSADSVFQIAMCEEIFSIERQYEICEIARKILKGEHGVARVIARPFIKTGEGYVRTANRRDFSLEPDEDNVLVKIKNAGLTVAGVGKIEDIFAGVGITDAKHTKDNQDGIDVTLEYMESVEKGLIYTNLVEFDMKWGHRNDVEGYAKGLEEFDERLPEIMEKMKADDVLIITADHGCDPTTPSTDHSREYVPMIMFGDGIKQGVNLGTRATFADMGQSIADMLGVEKIGFGTSYYPLVKKCDVGIRMYDVINHKKYGMELSKEEIEYAVNGYVKGEIPDYQMSSLLMAIYFNGMNEREVTELTLCMANSGDMIDLSEIEGVKVDKHSTGGVGDKTSLVLAPMIAALGVPMAKMSGRGLGHTGGTIDKLESFTGFNVAIEKERFIDIVNEKKIAIAGQTGNLAPADKKLYALRDVTATVDSIPLIASSIMSKKLAAGADVIVLDVKVGSGAFMKNEEDAKKLAKTMVDIGNGAGRKTVAVISDMDEPLGNAVGNILEVIEAIDTLKGKGSKDLEELCLVLGAYMLMGAAVYETYDEAYKALKEVLQNGKALAKFKEWIGAQGGDISPIDNYEKFEKAKIVYELKAWENGYINHINAEEVGAASLILGGGRETKESEIDLSVGIVFVGKVGTKVNAGDVLARVYANDEKKLALAVERLRGAYEFSATPGDDKKLIKAVV